MTTKKTDNSEVDLKKEIEIKPIRDFHIFFPPLYDIHLVEGVSAKIPLLFKQNLITEQVIKE